MPVRRANEAIDTLARRIEMGIVLFLVDNSASMNERTYAGTNLLDIAKTAVDNFVKVCLARTATRSCAIRRGACLCVVSSCADSLARPG